MSSPLKQCVGVDCSKDELVVRYGQLDPTLMVRLKARGCFGNDQAGIEQLCAWADRQAAPLQADLLFVVEATGVYHQKLAYALHAQGRAVSVVLPNKANHFAQTLKPRTVTDRTACNALTTMGLEKTLDPWSPPDPLFAALKQLTRERKRLKDHMTQLKNQRHAAGVATQTLDATLGRLAARLELCAEQVDQIEQEITALIASNKQLKKRFDCVDTIDGVGVITAATVVGEANGFTMVRNVRQLVSYAGYDVVEKESGTSVRGKPRISKQGNSHIRRALYFPAIVAVQKNKSFNSFYQRLTRRHGISMKAYTAVQRKLLVLIYTLWTSQQAYDPQYQQKEMEQPKEAAPHELA